MINRSLLANVGWLAGDRVVRLGGGLLVGVWMARYLGPSDFGLLSYTIAFSALFGILSTLGLDGIVVREGVNQRFTQETLLGTAFRLRLYGSIVGLIVSVALGALSGSAGLTLMMIVLGSGVYLAQSLYVIDWYFQATNNNRPSVLAQNGAFIASSLIKVLLILTHMPVVAFAICNVFEAALASIVLLFLYRRSSNNSGWSFDSQVARVLLKQSWPLILSGLAFMIYVRLDQVMIGRMLGNDSVGIYAAAIRISEVWNMIPVVVVTVAFPRLLALRLTDIVSYEINIQRLFSVLVAISLVAAVGTQIFGKWAILLLYGPSYVEAAAILQISIWSAIFSALGFASGRWLIAEELVKYALLRNLVGVVINIAANLILIPIYGAKGAAVGTLISYMFANLFSYVTARPLHRLFWINLKALFLIGLVPRRYGTPPRLP
jgi:PST family polysaccharide transporter